MSSGERSVNLVVIAGIRAQFMKVASLQRAVRQWNNEQSTRVHVTYVNSGQHYSDDLAGSFLKELDIHFDIDLTHAHDDHRPISILGNMIIQLYEVLTSLESSTQWVIVFGDANTTMAGSIAAAKCRLPVVHVEAGLRSRNIREPEEQNRVVADHLSTVHFLSSRQDLSNLLREGINRHVFWAGDLIYDLVKSLASSLPSSHRDYEQDSFVLSTIHREENVQSDEIMRNVMHSLSGYSKPVVFIAHPRTRRRLRELKLDRLRNIDYLDTLQYKEILSAIKGCMFVVTDSGALQRESYYLGKRCLIRQDRPFWPSLTAAGIHRLIEGNMESISDGFRWMEQVLISDQYPVIDDLGDGNAGLIILRHLVELSLCGSVQHVQQ